MYDTQSNLASSLGLKDGAIDASSKEWSETNSQIAMNSRYNVKNLRDDGYVIGV